MRPVPMSERYAIYYAPPAASACWRLATSWLGHDPEGGAVPERPALPGIDAETAEQATREPRRYGFHATLKPPFALAGGAGSDALVAALETFAAERSGFLLPALALADLDGFLALVPAVRDDRLNDLAAECVRRFEPFRAPATPEETARRRAAGLSVRQEAYLAQWGYPYVFDEFRFHMTLTARLDARLRKRLEAALGAYFAEICARPLPVDGVALYRQPVAGAPFSLVRRFAFAA